MTLGEIFDLGIALGITADPRGKAGVQKYLDSLRKKSEKLEGDAKKYFDPERLTNPYADTRIYYGERGLQIKHMYVGIDVETPELILLDKKRSNGEKIDAVMGHHPEGRAWGEIDQVMDVQVKILEDMGVPVNVSEKLMEPRRELIYRRVHARNQLRMERAAEKLDIPVFNCHNPADHLCAQFMYKNILHKEYDSLQEIVNALRDVPEYAHYAKGGNPPIIANGSGSNRPGKTVLYGFNGGTSGPTEFIDAMSHAGVGTFLSMHISDDDRKKAQECNINVIQCSHMGSDSLGMNIVLDVVQKKDPKLQIVPFSGFVRVER